MKNAKQTRRDKCQRIVAGLLITSFASATQAGTLDGAAFADTNSVAIGSGADATGEDSVAIGNNSFTFSSSAVALGSTSNANSFQSTAIGASALADQPQATALGSFAQAFGEAAVAVGGNANVEGVTGGSALGSNTYVEANNGTAVGAGAEVLAGAENSVALGAGSLADQAGTVSVGNSDTGLTRRVTNVANAVDDFDAVNFGQFKDGLSSVRHDAFAGIAAAAAFNPAVPSAPGKTAVALGAATYRGEQAMSVSFSHRLPGESKALLNGGFAYDSSSHALGRVGVAWEF